MRNVIVGPEFLQGEEGTLNLMGGSYSLTMIGRQLLLDYESLEQVRQSSRSATKFATAALIVSIVAIAIQILLVL